MGQAELRAGGVKLSVATLRQALREAVTSPGQTVASNDPSQSVGYVTGQLRLECFEVYNNRGVFYNVHDVYVLRRMLPNSMQRMFEKEVRQLKSNLAEEYHLAVANLKQQHRDERVEARRLLANEQQLEKVQKANAVNLKHGRAAKDKNTAIRKEQESDRRHQLNNYRAKERAQVHALQQAQDVVARTTQQDPVQTRFRQTQGVAGALSTAVQSLSANTQTPVIDLEPPIERSRANEYGERLRETLAARVAAQNPKQAQQPPPPPPVIVATASLAGSGPSAAQIRLSTEALRFAVRHA